jgi:dihydrofolate synthase/folylpolyglutamate synthase
MKDFAASEDPAVQTQLDRLAALSLPQGRIGLEVVHELLARMGNPQDQLPPVFHVAGTNGKGSTCAYLRAMLEAQGLVVHSATKPHLVRYNERIRLAGQLISDTELAAVLQEVLDIGEDLGPSFFEVTTVATFLAFARNPADACVIEVGLGGRLDATNVMQRPAACGIATLGIDHERFLLVEEEGAPSPTANPMVRIAFEKAGIARSGSPLVTQAYAPEVEAEVARVAALAGAPLRHDRISRPLGRAEPAAAAIARAPPGRQCRARGGDDPPPERSHRVARSHGARHQSRALARADAIARPGPADRAGAGPGGMARRRA